MKYWFWAISISLLGAYQSVLAKPVEIVVWHAFAGSLGHEFHQLADTFNRMQSDYVVKTVYKGSYSETLTAFAAAYRVHATPALLQVFEVGSSAMLRSKNVVKPAGQLLREQGVNFDAKTLWPALASYYVQNKDLTALPLNVSMPVMYYNATKLRSLGYTKETFPKTWTEFEVLLQRLKTQGSRCAYTTAYPTWIHIETYTSLHQLDNASLASLAPHLKRLMRWQNAHLFEYAGRLDEATVLFTSQHCALFSQSSGAYENLRAVVPFELGVATLPYDPDIVEQRGANVVGGAALWVVNGLPKEVEKGVATFFKFLLTPETQFAWYRKTGYLPIIRHDKTEGLLSLVQSEWRQAAAHPETMSRAQHRIRLMNDELLESLFSGMMSVDDMLKQLSITSGYAQLRFEKNHGMV